MDFDALLTLGVIVALFVALLRNWAPPDLMFVAATTALTVVGIITPEQAFRGFANPGVLTVAALFVVASAMRETGVLDYLGHLILGGARTAGGALVRLGGLVLPMSAFLNNTPIVALFTPVLLDWSRRHNISPSRVLIPLSYLAILGGTCTLIGTSTNLVVNGLMLDAGLPGLGLFEIAWIGIPYAMVGFTYLIVVGGWLLPERKELLEQLGDASREYTAEMRVEPGCRLVGHSVETAGLRHLPGLFLIEIEREGQIVAPVGPDDVILANDRLTFAGIVSSIIDLEKIPGLVPTVDPSYEVSPQQQRRRRLCEAVVSVNSPLIGKTIREADFRATYGAAVLAVHRGGSRVERKIGDIRLRPGDTLLLQTRPHFQRANRNNPAFYLVSNVDDYRPLRRDRAWISLGLFVLLLALMSFEILSPLVASMLIAAAMVACGCISSGDARRSVEWQVLITIAAAFGIGAALDESGAAKQIATWLVDNTQVWGPIAALAAVYLLGSITTEMITNNAAAVLMFPFCIETARQFEVSEMPFIIAIMLAASASFVTPIGYQTNMMVYGPGGYRFSDFIRIGLPLNLILWTLAILLIPRIWPF